MARSGNQKQKILYLIQMLAERDSEENALPMREIMEKLEEYQIRAERKSIYDDMEALREFGFPIRYNRKRPGGYYLAGEMPAGFLKTESRAEESGEMALSCGEDTGEEKTVKISCPISLTGRIRAYLNGPLEVKEKKDGMAYVTGQAATGEAFYGWLTSLGPEAKLVKPKKDAAAYRDYLKAILKKYKDK